MAENYRDMKALTDIMARLRAEGGCPWDREQNHESLRRYLIEESYEVLDAIDRKNNKDLCEELGDLLLQVVFHDERRTWRFALAGGFSCSNCR